MELEPVGKFMWEKIIRRVELEPAEMLIALVLSTYAGEDGDDVRPGLRRLVNVTPYSRATICRALSRLRDLGLIEYVFQASVSGRKGAVDEYRLTIPWNLPDRVSMLDPEENHISPVRPGLRVIHNQVSPMRPPPGLTHETRPGLTHETHTNQVHQPTYEATGLDLAGVEGSARAPVDNPEKRIGVG